MTTIITYRTDKKVYMLGDRVGAMKGVIKIDCTKVFQHKDWLIGLAGALGGAYPIIDLFKNLDEKDEAFNYPPAWFAKKLKADTDEDDEVTLILANKEKSYMVVAGGFFPIEEQFFSIGCGSPFAYGAYEAFDTIALALWEDKLDSIRNMLIDIMQVCIKRDPATGGEIQILELDL